MSYGYLSQMLEYLTGAYARQDMRNDRHSLPLETNIGRLFGTLAWGLEIIHENADRLKLWDDIDNAVGDVLDRYGANFGVARGGADDTFYRLLIKVKMIALLSGGDINTIITAAASLFNVDASEIEVQELFPAKIWIYVDEDILDAERLEAAPLIAELMKRIAAAGVGTRVFLRTYQSGRGRSYLGIAALEQTDHTAKIRQATTQRGAARFFVATTVFEDIIITGANRR